MHQPFRGAGAATRATRILPPPREVTGAAGGLLMNITNITPRILPPPRHQCGYRVKTKSWYEEDFGTLVGWCAGSSWGPGHSLAPVAKPEPFPLQNLHTPRKERTDSKPSVHFGAKQAGRPVPKHGTEQNKSPPASVWE